VARHPLSGVRSTQPLLTAAFEHRAWSEPNRARRHGWRRPWRWCKHDLTSRWLTRLRRHAAHAFVLIAALLSSHTPLRAANVSVTTTVGFADRFQVGKWTPVNLSVQNLGPAFDATISVSLGGGNALEGNTHRVTQQRTVHLPSGVQRNVGFTFFVASFAHPIEVTVARGAKIVTSSQSDLRPRYSDLRVALILTHGVDLDYLGSLSPGECGAAHASDRTNRTCAAPARTGLARAYPATEHLPQTWFGYDGVEVLIVRGRSLERLSAAQYSALIGWLVNGGRLLVSGTSNIALMNTPRLRTLLPVTPRGLVRSSTGAFELTLHDIADGDHVRERLGLHPLMAERPVGKGAVIYITADVAQPAFAQWAQAGALWQRASGAVDQQTTQTAAAGAAAHREQGVAWPRANAGVRERVRIANADWVGNALLELPLPWPSLVTVLVFALGYLAVLAAADPSRVTGTRRQALIVLMPVLTGSMLALCLFVLPTSTGPALISLAMMQRLPDLPYAHAHYELGIYARDRSDWAWQSDAMAPAWRHAPRPNIQAARTAAEVSAAVQEAVNWVFDYGDSPTAMATHRARVKVVRPYVVETLVGEDVLHVPSTATRVDANHRIELTLDNQGPVRWHASWLVSANTVIATGSLATGARATRPITAASDKVREPPTRNWHTRLVSAQLGTNYPYLAVAQAIAKRVESLIAQQPTALWLVAITDSPLALSVHSAKPAAAASYGVLVLPVAERQRTGE
jgi:hypothetical protein